MLTTDKRHSLAAGGLDVAAVEARVSAAAGQRLVAVEARTVFLGTSLVLESTTGRRYLLDDPDDGQVRPLRRPLPFLAERPARHPVPLSDLAGRS